MVVERVIKMTKEEEKAIKITMKIIEDMACELGVSAEELFNEFYEMPQDVNFNGECIGSQTYDDYEIEVVDN